MNTLKILYIDDNPEPALSKFLDSYKSVKCNFEYSDIKFNPNDGYESLINCTEVKSANIIIVDSSLFENRNATKGKFTGEEFKIILRKYFPFIEVIVISQKEVDADYETIPKYNPKYGKTAQEYYNEILPNLLEKSIRNIFETRKIACEMEKNTSWERVLVEKIVNSINGEEKYDEFTKKDIDDVIKMFRELQDKIEG